MTIVKKQDEDDTKQKGAGPESSYESYYSEDNINDLQNEEQIKKAATSKKIEKQIGLYLQIGINNKLRSQKRLAQEEVELKENLKTLNDKY